MAATEQCELNIHRLILTYPCRRSASTFALGEEASSATMTSPPSQKRPKLSGQTVKTQATERHEQ